MSNAVTALGLCDGTPEWWAHYVDVLTRAPRFDDEDTDAFAVARRLDPVAVREAFSPVWASDRVIVGALRGPIPRYPYGYQPDPAPTDSCRYGDGLCDGSCGG